MPLYEYKQNAENVIHISEKNKQSVIIGTQKVIDAMVQKAAERQSANIALDGWYGIDYFAVESALKKALDAIGRKAVFIHTKSFYLSVEKLKKYKQCYITEDLSFGYVNSEGHIEDIMDKEYVNAVRDRLSGNKTELLFLIGSGAANKMLSDCCDLIYFFDITMQSLLLQMWDGKLIPFGFDKPDNEYNWKEYYYCDFYLLHRHKKEMYHKMDFYVEAISFDDLKLLPREAYNEIISTVVKYPIKQVQIFQPGPWGAYRYRDLWDVPGLECSAWNKMSGPEMSVIIDFGAEKPLNVTLLSLLQYNEQITGTYWAKECPDLFPLDIWLDDGYFPEKQPAERTSMPIHNHPGTEYVKKHFNEPLGRYETYYIVEAYEGANTWMGYYDTADLEEWEAKCFESNNLKPIENWKEYVCNWKSNVGDLYLIPPGTAHGHGGNQMVLEMDTSPSVAGTEYSFFQYDYARNSWDDNVKSMTGKPLKMHLEHAFDNEKWRRETYVKNKLRARPEIVFWKKNYWMDRYSTLPEMPFEVERLHFYKNAEYSTYYKYLQIVTLTVGNNVIIRSKTDPEKQTVIERLQCVAIPAGFGDYELLSVDDSFCTCVVFRMKKG